MLREIKKRLKNKYNKKEIINNKRKVNKEKNVKNNNPIIWNKIMKNLMLKKVTQKNIKLKVTSF